MASVNYQLAAALVDPNVSFAFSETPTVYSSLIFKTVVVSQADCETAWLISEKLKQIATLTAAAQNAAISGFKSDALVPGNIRGYTSDLQSQIVIIGALSYLNPANGISVPPSYTIPSSNLSDGSITFNAYTYSQFYKLFTDMAEFSASIYTQLSTKISEINSINTGNVNNDLDSVYAITWD